MAPFILKFKGNKSFVAFHNMNDGDSLTKTWKVCTKVAAHLEQGQRLENLSWRLWHLHNIMVETDNAKSKRDFKKLSRTMGDKLDREKGKNIEELRAPGYKRTESSDKMRRRAEEIERLRDESHSGVGMKRMQFTFSLDTPSPSAASFPKSKMTVTAQPGKKTPVFKEPPLRIDTTKPSPKTAYDKKADKTTNSSHSVSPDADKSKNQRVDKVSSAPMTSHAPPATPESSDPSPNVSTGSAQAPQSSVRLPGIFSSHFGPTALLHPSPSFAPSLSYGEDVTSSHVGSSISPNGGMGVSRPTIELPLDELLEVDGDISDTWGDVLAGIEASQSSEDQAKDPNGRCVSVENALAGGQDEQQKPFDLEFEMAQIIQADRSCIKAVTSQPSVPQQIYSGSSTFHSKQSSNPPRQRHTQTGTLNPMALHQKAHATVNNGTGTGPTPGAGRGTPSATAVPTSTPAGQKTECSNCGATHTPLWRRGLNDELNCNACGLYCKLHKRPRPKSMRAQHGDNARNINSHSRNVDNDAIGAKCFNCHTTATPLWRKDDEGKTVCNACGLYYKLHGTNRPLSMKSDVIRKRSRHEIRRAGLAGSSSETPSASPGASRRASPARAASPPPAPEEEHREEEPKTPQFSYDYTSKSSQTDHTTNNSPPNDMLSSVSPNDQSESANEPNTTYPGYFPGPYHPDYLYQMMSSAVTDSQPAQNGDASGYGIEDRGNKRRRLSSASYDSSSTPTDPPSSATSLNSGQSKSPTSSPSFPSYGLPYPAYNYSSDSDTTSAWLTGRIHPPMVLPDDAPMEFLHPPMVLPEQGSQSSSSYPYLHPPMLPVEEAALTYMHPPMQPGANSPIVGYTHPPMLSSYWNNDQNSTYNDNSTNSNENSNSTEIFDSMMNSLE